MTVSQAGTFNVQEFTDAGLPLALGRLYTYAYGTTTQKIAYTDAAGLVPHTYTLDASDVPYIALNSRGELPAPLYLLADGPYDLALKRPDGSTVWTRRADGVAAASDVVFTADGTGAQTLTNQKKLRQKLNVMDFIDPSMWSLIESGTTAGQNATLVAAGIQAAIAAAITKRKRLEASGGIYLHNALTVPGGLEVAGEGRNATKFVLATVNGTGWTINSTAACGFRDMTLNGQNTSTSGDLIQVNGTSVGTVNLDSEFLNLTIGECWNGFHPQNAGAFALRDSYLVDCFGSAALIENVASPDNGDSSISGCVLANTNGVGYGIQHLSSGGLRLVNNKSLGFKKAYWLNPATGVTTSILIATGNSFEGFTEHGLLFDTSGGTYGNIQAIGNEISIFGTGAIGIQHKSHQNFNYSANVFRAGSSTEIGIDIVSGGPGIISANTMQANGGNTGFGIRIQSGASNVTVAPQRFQGWGTPISNASSSSKDFSTLGSAAVLSASDFKLTAATDKTVGGQLVSLSSSDATNQLQMLMGLQPGYTYIQSVEQGIANRPLMLNRSGGSVVVGATADDATGAKLQVNGSISTNPTTTTTAPGAGGAGALPATPAGYKTEFINGVSRKIPYY